MGGLDPVGIDGDLDGHLDAIFAIAERRGVGVDIHLHDGGEGGIAQIHGDRRAHQGRGPAGQGRGQPCLRAGLGADRLAERTADLLAETGVAIMSHGPGGATIPPLKLLREHGVGCSAAPTISAMPGRPSATATCWSAP